MLEEKQKQKEGCIRFNQTFRVQGKKKILKKIW